MTGTALGHEALLYRSDERFVAALTPFLAEGLRHGDATVAVVTPHHLELLRRSLGDDATRVRFIDRDAWYDRPVATIARWIDLVGAALAGGHRSIRVVGEVAFRPEARIDSWIRYESAVNDVFAGVPARILCPYDTRRLPDRVIAGVLRTHPVVDAGRRGPSDRYERPEHLLRDLPEPLPPVTRAPLVAMSLTGPHGPRHVRRAIEAMAHARGWDRTTIGKLSLVVTEIAVNSLTHGRGDRRIRVWIDDGSITCEVADDGDGPGDPLAGYRPPADPQSHGMGLWLANRLSDWLAIDHGDGTTRVRFRLTP